MTTQYTGGSSIAALVTAVFIALLYLRINFLIKHDTCSNEYGVCPMPLHKYEHNKVCITQVNEQYKLKQNASLW